jgi:hypothetical protein
VSDIAVRYCQVTAVKSLGEELALHPGLEFRRYYTEQNGDGDGNGREAGSEQ